MKTLNKPRRRKGKTKSTTVRMSIPTHKRLSDFCDTNGLLMNRFIDRAVNEAIDTSEAR